MLTDARLLATYIGSSPFQISKRFLQERGAKNPWEYGETPLTTMEFIAKECAISSKDIFFELGCGRGRGCFWMRAFIGCSVVGIDFVPEFIRIANLVKRKTKVKEVTFIEQDYLKADLNCATVIYYYGTMAREKEIQSMIKKFSQLKPGAKIITVSYALSEYTKERIFEVLRSFPVHFQWGSADVYLQVRV